jgi:hypothetical protein
MDPIELQIQQRINEIQNTPGFTNYQNEGIAPLSLPNLDTNFISQENNSTIDQNFMPEGNNTNIDLFKKAAMNAARNKLISTIAQKVGIESLPSIATPLLGNFAAAALPVLGIGALTNIFGRDNVNKRILREAAKDQQGGIRILPVNITNMQPSARDIAMGGGDRGGGGGSSSSSSTSGSKSSGGYGGGQERGRGDDF